MGKFAKRLKRQQKVSRECNYQKVEKVHKRAEKQVKHATTKQILQDRKDISDTQKNLNTLVLVTVHDVLGYGKAKLVRFQKRASLQNQCEKAGLVTTSDFEYILAEECNFRFSKKEKFNSIYGEHYAELVSSTVNYLLLCYFVALRNEFQIGEIRLKRVYENLVSDSVKLINGELRIKNFIDKLKKIMQVEK